MYNADQYNVICLSLHNAIYIINVIWEDGNHFIIIR